MSSSKPTSTTSRPPKPPTTISSSAIISDTASLVGTHRITIGSNTVIHPRCKILSTYGPVIIGAGCVISERSIVGLSSSPVDWPSQKEDPQQDEQQMQMDLQDGVIIEIGAKVESRIIGEGTHVGINSRIGKGAIIGKYTKIGPNCHLDENEELPDHTILYGDGERRIDHHDIVAREMAVRGKHVEVLRGLVGGNLAKWRSD